MNEIKKEFKMKNKFLQLPIILFNIFIILSIAAFTGCSKDMIILFHGKPLKSESKGYLMILNESPEWSENVYGVTLDNENRLLIFGSIQYPGMSHDAAIWRYNRDATLDTNFGTNGVVTWNSPDNRDDIIYNVKVNPDGSLLIGAKCKDPSADNVNAMLGKLLPDGQPDTGFSASGFKVVDLDNNRINRVDAVKFDNSNRLLITGNHMSPRRVVAVRVKTSGIVDDKFSTLGYFQFPQIAEDYACGILVDSGYIYITVDNDGVNAADVVFNQTTVYKLNESDGTLIKSLSNIGLEQQEMYSNAVIQGDHLFISGYSLYPDSFALAKINKNNLTPDISYANNGVYIANPETNTFRGGNISLNAQGEAYIGGYSRYVSGDGLMVKLNSSGSIDRSWGEDGMIYYVDIGGVDADNIVRASVLYKNTIFVLGTTYTEVNSTSYQKIFIHHLNQ